MRNEASVMPLALGVQMVNAMRLLNRNQRRNLRQNQRQNQRHNQNLRRKCRGRGVR